MVDLGDRVGGEDEAEADDEPHAEPERDPGDDRQAGDVAGGEPGRRIKPVADRAAGDERKAERERDRIAGERGQRGQPVGHPDADMAERQAVVARQRQVAQRGEAEGEQDLVAAGRGKGGPELERIDAHQRAHKDRQRNGDDQDARRQTGAPQRDAMALDGRDESLNETRGIRGRRRAARRPVRGRASFLHLSHATFLWSRAAYRACADPAQAPDHRRGQHNDRLRDHASGAPRRGPQRHKRLRWRISEQRSPR